jgi:hypothetical protein
MKNVQVETWAEERFPWRRDGCRVGLRAGKKQLKELSGAEFAGLKWAVGLGFSGYSTLDALSQ